MEIVQSESKMVVTCNGEPLTAEAILLPVTALGSNLLLSGTAPSRMLRMTDR